MKKVCPKSGIKIHESNNTTRNNNITSFPIQSHPQDQHNIDLNIDNYSCEDLFNLLGISDKQLDDTVMKNVKNVVLKTHPDKSNLPSEYFIFFSKAYNRLVAIYKSQNKAIKNAKNANTEYSSQSSNQFQLLDNFFETNKEFKNPNHFNKWFNEKFDKYNIKEEETGYGDWLKTNEGILDVGNVSQSQMASEMEKHKERLQGLVAYKGIQDTYSSSSIMSMSDDNFSDLKQAYEESIIPITQQDYLKKKKFNNINEYTTFRDQEHRNVKPMSEVDAKKVIQKQHRELDDQCISMTFQNLKKMDQQKEQTNLFWSDLKRLT